MTTTVVQLQREFHDYILAPENKPSAITTQISEQIGLNAADRLRIYYDAYRIRLRGALAEAFPKTFQYLGDDLFAELSSGYIAEQPSQLSNLRWYGATFPAYLSSHLPDYPIVAELANFEWTLGIAFDAEDVQVLGRDDLQKWTAADWETQGFRLQPSAQFLQMNWNATAIWLALDRDAEVPEPTLSPETVHWIIWRKSLQSHFRSIDSAEADALADVQRGLAFSVVCERIAERPGDADMSAKIGGWLQGWIDEGLLAESARI